MTVALAADELGAASSFSWTGWQRTCSTIPGMFRGCPYPSRRALRRGQTRHGRPGALMTRLRSVFLATALVAGLALPAIAQTAPLEQPDKEAKRTDVFERTPPLTEQVRDLKHALSRLPIAAGLACVLAFRPRRKG